MNLLHVYLKSGDEQMITQAELRTEELRRHPREPEEVVPENEFERQARLRRERLARLFQKTSSNDAV